GVSEARSGFPWASLLHVARGATTVAPTQLSRRRQEIALLADFRGNAAGRRSDAAAKAALGTHTPQKGRYTPRAIAAAPAVCLNGGKGMLRSPLLFQSAASP